MITKSSVQKSFDGNSRYDGMLPEYAVDVKIEFDSPTEAHKFVADVEALLEKFPRRTSMTKKERVKP